jgi:hypothetical protein
MCVISGGVRMKMLVSSREIFLPSFVVEVQDR